MFETHSANQPVRGLYEKYPGEFGKLVGIFSSVDHAKNCKLIQPLLQESWRYCDVGSGSVIWQAKAIDPLHPNDPFCFLIEEIHVDQLVESLANSTGSRSCCQRLKINCHPPFTQEPSPSKSMGSAIELKLPANLSVPLF